MLRSFRAEAALLRRRVFLLGSVGSLVVASVLGVVISFTRAGKGPDALTVARLSQDDGLAAVLQRSAELIGIAALGITAVAVAQGYVSGMLRVQLVREPRRLRFLAGQVAADVALVLCAVVLAVAAATVTALLLGPARGIHTAGWFGAGLGTTVSTYGDVLLSAAGFGIFGAVLALVFRSPAPAVILGFAWSLPVEGLLTAVWADLGKWLPARQLDVVVSHGDKLVPYGQALSLGAGYVAVAAALGMTLFRRRDVTA